MSNIYLCSNHSAILDKWLYNILISLSRNYKYLSKLKKSFNYFKINNYKRILYNLLNFCHQNVFKYIWHVLNLNWNNSIKWVLLIWKQGKHNQQKKVGCDIIENLDFVNL